jgi:hypothetical protein
MPVDVVERLQDFTLEQRVIRHHTVVRAVGREQPSENREPRPQLVKVAVLMFQACSQTPCPPPSAALPVTAGDERRGKASRALTRGSPVSVPQSALLSRRQHLTLLAMMECILSRLVFTASEDMQRVLALRLAKRFRVFLPAAPTMDRKGTADGDHQPSTGSTGGVRGQMAQLIPVAVPLVLELLDELRVRELVQDAAATTRMAGQSIR